MKNFSLIDLHSDVLTSMGCPFSALSLASECEKGGYKAINAIFRGNRSYNYCFKLAQKAKLEQGLFIAFEDCCYLDFLLEKGDGVITEEGVYALSRALASLSPLYCSLGWNGLNVFCGGCAENGRLSTYGRTFIRYLNELCIPLDLSHISHEAFFEALDAADRVLCSHTALCSAFAHRRNLTSGQISAIINKGGIIGITAVGHFLTGVKRSIKSYEMAFYEHIDAYLQKFGVKGLAIGTDFFGSNAPAFNDGDYPLLVQKLHRALERLGVQKEEEQRIFYANSARFFGIKDGSKCDKQANF